MRERHPSILIVEPDADLLEMLVEALIPRLNPRITCVATAADALDVELTDPHDLVIAEADVPEAERCELAFALRRFSERPVILLSDTFSAEDLTAALRHGISDVFTKPFAIGALTASVRRALRTHRHRQQQFTRYHRLRRHLRRALKDRSTLAQRVELVCRDLVEAHRQLLQRVLARHD